MNRLLKTCLVLLLAIAALGCAKSALADEHPKIDLNQGWKSLFNGKDLTGWRPIKSMGQLDSRKRARGSRHLGRRRRHAGPQGRRRSLDRRPVRGFHSRSGVQNRAGLQQRSSVPPGETEQPGGPVVGGGRSGDADPRHVWSRQADDARRRGPVRHDAADEQCDAQGRRVEPRDDHRQGEQDQVRAKRSEGHRCGPGSLDRSP